MTRKIGRILVNQEVTDDQVTVEKVAMGYTWRDP